MSTFAHWNRKHMLVFTRFSRRYGIRLTPEIVSRLVRRFALKHARAITEGRGPHGHPRHDPHSPSHPRSSAFVEQVPAPTPFGSTRPWRAARLFAGLLPASTPRSTHLLAPLPR